MKQGQNRPTNGGRITVVGKDLRLKKVRFRLNAKEAHLWKDVCSKTGFKTEAHVFRHLVDHYGDIERAQRIVDAFKRYKAAEADLKALIGD